MSENNLTQNNGLDVALLQQQFRQNGLGEVLNPADNIVVTGLLTPDVIEGLKQANVEVVINVQPEDELTFDEQAALQAVGIDYADIAIRGAEDLTEATIAEFDKALNTHEGKNTLMHCKSGNRVGAAVALRDGWIRGCNPETALANGKAAGLLGLEQEVQSRLLAAR
jgi:protein tyrosine phosphatase (PTP) superfamily phosphohydrolase (DUF442 family)